MDANTPIWTVSVSSVWATGLCLDSYRGSSSVRQPKFGISGMLVQTNKSGAYSLGVVFPHDRYPTRVRDAEEPISSSFANCAFSIFTLHSFHSCQTWLPIHSRGSRPLSDVQVTQMVAIPATLVLPSTSTWWGCAAFKPPAKSTGYPMSADPTPRAAGW